MARGHNALDRRDDWIGLQALVAFDGGERFALTDRVTDRLCEAADYAGKTCSDIADTLGIGGNHTVDGKRLADGCGTRLGQPDAGGLDLLRSELDRAGSLVMTLF